MASKILIIAAVAVVVAGASYFTYLQEPDETPDLRTYLVTGDWAEYSVSYPDEGQSYTSRYLVTEISSPMTATIEISEYEYNYTIDGGYQLMFLTIDQDDPDLKLVREKTVDTFLGKTSCDVYQSEQFDGVTTYYADSKSGLVLRTEYEPSVEDRSRFVSELTGTSIFTPVTGGEADYFLGTQFHIGSTYAYETVTNYSNSNGEILYTSYTTSTEIQSMNYDGTFNIMNSDTPITAEEFASGYTWSDELHPEAEVTGSETLSTQWGIVDCDVYTIFGYQFEGIGSGDLHVSVDPDTGLVLRQWAVIPDATDYNGMVWEECIISKYILECTLVQIAD